MIKSETDDLLFELLFHLLVLFLQLGLGLNDGLHLSLQHLLFTGQLVHFQYQVFVHHIQSVPAQRKTFLYKTQLARYNGQDGYIKTGCSLGFKQLGVLLNEVFNFTAHTCTGFMNKITLSFQIFY